MTKEVLDIKLAGIDSNRPGSKGVAEAMGVDLANPGPHPVTSEHNVHVVIAKHPASLMVIGRPRMVGGANSRPLRIKGA